MERIFETELIYQNPNKMKFVLLLFGLISLGYATPIAELFNEEWIEFKLKHSKQYSSEEEERFRLKVFLKNKYKIAKHNQLYDQNRTSFRMAMNQFGDLLTDEFNQMMNGHLDADVMKWDELEMPYWRIGMSYFEQTKRNISNSTDWREKGAVTEVKNQGYYATSWAFASTGALEGQHFRSTGALISLSEQNLIDCSHRYRHFACRGGSTISAFQYIIESGGIDSEKSYPYKAQEQSTCKYNPKEIGATIRGFNVIDRGSEQSLTAAISSIGPIAVAIDASHHSFQFYKEGIYFEPSCSTQIIFFDILAIGYGTDKNGSDYYILKNSWGTGWGEKGYMKIARNRGNACGIATFASFPVV